MKRRTFLLNGSLALATAKFASTASAHPSKSGSSKIRFGLIADLHQDFTFGAPQRLQAFIDEMNRQKPDFILELGDFCFPIEQNKQIAEIWNGFKGPKYHTIGNHDLQHFTPAQVVQFWGMPNRYYSFDQRGFHMIVLDCNDPDPKNPTERYPAGVNEEQMNWLLTDLAATKLPTMVFCHQGVDNAAVRNRESVRILQENTASRNGNGKVIAVFSGHFHSDYHNCINGIHHIQINSASYQWWGKQITNDSYGTEAEKVHPLIKHMSFYKDPLWALVEVDAAGTIRVTGKKSAWMGKSPEELKVIEPAWKYRSVPLVSDRLLKF